LEKRKNIINNMARVKEDYTTMLNYRPDQINVYKLKCVIEDLKKEIELLKQELIKLKKID